MNKKVAFVIPLHPKHFCHAYSHLQFQYEFKKQLNIFYVFSSDQDYNLFMTLLTKNNHSHLESLVNPIIIPTIHTPGIITFKKWYALSYIKLNYDFFEYVITIDAEIKFLEENTNDQHIFDRCKYIFTNKKFYGGQFDIIQQTYLKTVNTACLETLQSNPYNSNKIRNETKDLAIYLWWSDLNVYQLSDIDHFFDCIGYDYIQWDVFSYDVFDHIVYQYYCIVYHNFQVIDMTSILKYKWSIEKYQTDQIENLDNLLKYGYKFSIVWHRAFETNVDIKKWYIKNGVFILYHLDRVDQTPFT